MRTRRARRTRLTHALVRRAFTDLLKEKPIQRITVREVCQRAGINRSTFYAHYTDLYDLLHQMEEDMLADFQQALAPILDHGPEPPSFLQVITEIYRCLKRKRRCLHHPFGGIWGQGLRYAAAFPGVGKLSGSLFQPSVGSYSRQLEYFYAFVSSGHIGLLQKWLEEGMTTSVEEMAKMAQSIMLHGMDFLQGIPSEEDLPVPAPLAISSPKHFHFSLRKEEHDEILRNDLFPP